MSETVSRRSMLQIGACVPSALGSLSIVSPALAEGPDISALWETYDAVRTEANRRHGVWLEACNRAEARMPDLPEGLAFPNPQFAPWLQIERDGTVWAVRKGKGLYYRPEILADFLADPPEIRSDLDAERVPRIVGLIRDLLPIAERYVADVKEIWREVDAIHDACRFDDLHDRQFAAAAAVMGASVTTASDFVFKAKVLRSRLDDDLGVDVESSTLVDQMIAFWSDAASAHANKVSSFEGL